MIKPQPIPQEPDFETATLTKLKPTLLPDEGKTLIDDPRTTIQRAQLMREPPVEQFKFILALKELIQKDKAMPSERRQILRRQISAATKSAVNISMRNANNLLEQQREELQNLIEGVDDALRGPKKLTNAKLKELLKEKSDAEGEIVLVGNKMAQHTADAKLIEDFVDSSSSSTSLALQGPKGKKGIVGKVAAATGRLMDAVGDRVSMPSLTSVFSLLGRTPVDVKVGSTNPLEAVDEEEDKQLYLEDASRVPVSSTALALTGPVPAPTSASGPAMAKAMATATDTSLEPYVPEIPVVEPSSVGKRREKKEAKAQAKAQAEAEAKTPEPEPA